MPNNKKQKRQFSPSSPTTPTTPTNVQNSLKQFQRQQEILEGKIFDMEQKLDQQDREISSLKKSKEDVVLELSHERMRNQTLSNNINDLEQYSRRSNIRIFGVHDNNKKESINETENIVRDLLRRKLNLNFGPEDFDICHRVGRFVEGSNRAIIVKFIYRKSKILTIANRKKLKNSGITISEDLTHKNVKRLQDIKMLSYIEDVWSKDGRIFAKNSRNIVKEIKNNDTLSESLFAAAPMPTSHHQTQVKISEQHSSAASSSNVSEATAKSKGKTPENNDSANNSSNNKSNGKEKSIPKVNENNPVKPVKKTPTKSDSKDKLNEKQSPKKKQDKNENVQTNSQKSLQEQPPSSGDGSTLTQQTSDDPEQTSVKSINTDEQAMEITGIDGSTSTPPINERLKSIAEV